jgi:hypothetical protein
MENLQTKTELVSNEDGTGFRGTVSYSRTAEAGGWNYVDGNGNLLPGMTDLSIKVRAPFTIDSHGKIVVTSVRGTIEGIEAMATIVSNRGLHQWNQFAGFDDNLIAMDARGNKSASS